MMLSELMYKFLCGLVFISFGYILRSRIAGSYGNFMFNISRNWQTISKQPHNFIFLSTAYTGFSLSTFLPMLVWCLQTSIPLWFWVPFPDGYWCLASFHVFIDYVYFFSGEISIYILCPFVSWVTCFSIVNRNTSLYSLDTSPLSDT